MYNVEVLLEDLVFGKREPAPEPQDDDVKPKDEKTHDADTGKRYFQACPEAAVAKKIKVSSQSTWLKNLREKKAAEDTVKPKAVVVDKVERSTKVLSQGLIRIRNLNRLNHGSARHNRPVVATGFLVDQANRPPLIWTAGQDKKVEIFSMEETMRKHVSTIQTSKSLLAACSTTDRRGIFCSGGEAYLYHIDIETGKTITLPRLEAGGMSLNRIIAKGNLIMVLDALTGRVHSLDYRSNKVVRVYNSGTMTRAITFDPANELGFITGDSRGELFWWTTTSGRCSRRSVVDVSLGIESLGKCGSSRLLVGCSSDCVAMVDLTSPNYETVKVFNNLGVLTDSIVSHEQAPIAIVGSSLKEDAVRLIHAKGFVYQNWPVNGGAPVRLEKMTCGAFGPDGTFCLGNQCGYGQLFEMTDLAAFSSANPEEFV